MTDRELLEMAARAAGPLAAIGALAVAEHSAWLARNQARNALRKFYSDYREETGEWFDREVAIDCGDEAADVPKFDKLKANRDDAQRRHASAKAATRRAIVRAAAAIGSKQDAARKEST